MLIIGTGLQVAFGTPLEGTESDRNGAASNLPLVAAGESAAGKDNLRRLVLDWLSKLGGEDKPATHALLQGQVLGRGEGQGLEKFFVGLARAAQFCGLSALLKLKPSMASPMGGSITVTGLVQELLDNSGQLQIINGELEKVINKRKEKMLQESDLIELFDGAAAFGKRIGQQKACLKPVVWALLGARLEWKTPVRH